MKSIHPLRNRFSMLVLVVIVQLAGWSHARDEDPYRTELVTHLADRSTRDLERLIDDLQVAADSEVSQLLTGITLLAIERSGYLMEAAERDPAVAFAMMLSDEDRGIVDSIVPGQTGQPATLEGRVQVTFNENLVSGAYGVSYALFETTSQSELILRSGARGLQLLSSGSSVRIDGFLIGNQLLFDESGIGVTLLQAETSLPAGPKQFLAIIVHFNDAPAPRVVYSDIDAVYNQGGKSVQSYYSANSFGAETITADVQTAQALFGSEPTSLNVSEFSSRGVVRDAVIAKLESAQFSRFGDYFGIAIFAEYTPFATSTLSFINSATNGQEKVFSAGSGSTYLLATILNGLPTAQATQLYSNVHEVGHTLTAWHASFLQADPTLSVVAGGAGGVFKSGDVCEYGDPVSMMGGFFSPGVNGLCTAYVLGQAHLNALHKDEAGGWLDESIEVLDWVPGMPENLILRPISVPTANLPASENRLHLIRIRRGNMGSIYIEFRYPTDAVGGFETSTYLGQAGVPDGGAFIYVSPRPRKSALLDPVWGWASGQTPDARTAALSPGSPGESYTDLCSDVTITVGAIQTFSQGKDPELSISITADPSGCAFFGSPQVTFDSPLPGQLVPNPGGPTSDIVLSFSGYDDLQNLSVKVVASQAGHVAVTLGSDLKPDLATGKVTLTNINWSQFINGSVTLTAAMRDTPLGCCTYSSEASILLRVNKHLGQSNHPLTSVGATAPVVVPFSLAATATADDGVAGVEFWLDPQYADTCGALESHNGRHPENCKYHGFFPAYSKNFPVGQQDVGSFLIGTAQESPYTLTVDSLPPGTYTVRSRAHDSDGDWSLSEPVTLVVDGAGPFSVNIPIDEGTLVAADQVVEIAPSVTADAGELGYVDFFVDDVLLGTVDAAPYAWSWVVPSGSPTSHLIRTNVYGIGGRTAVDSVGVVVP